MTTTTREQWIDNAKGIAMICVIIGHVSGELTGIWNFRFVYGFHLVVFFLLSGYTMKKRELTTDFVNLKFSRLMVPYFYTCTAIMIMDVWNSYFLKHDCSITTISRLIGRDIVRSFFASGSITVFGQIELGTRIGAIWFLPTLFFAILFVQCFLWKTTDSWKLGIVTFCLSALGYITARFIWFPFSIQAGMFASFFLWIGYEIHRREMLSKLKWYHYLAAQLIFLAGIHYNYANIGFVEANIRDPVFSVLTGLSGCALVYFISIRMKKSRIISWIGRKSMCILCIHLFILETSGSYIAWILEHTGLSWNVRVWGMIILEILFPVVIAVFIDLGASFFNYVKMNRMTFITHIPSLNSTKRDISIDIIKSIFVLSMLAGHFSIDETLRKIIYSCHMVGFVFFSGYFYKKSQSAGKAVLHIIRTFLIPYFIFVLGGLILNGNCLSKEYIVSMIKRYLFGLSFTNKFFTDISSVGPVYFILMLFVVRFIYILIDRLLKNSGYTFSLVMILSFLGMKLGEKGYWLPWSMDIALYVLIFYQLGICFRKYDLLTGIKKNHFFYFILAPIWAYMIYMGGMEIAVRNYGKYGIAVIGAISGILLLYKLAVFLAETFSIISRILAYAGKSSLIIIFIHTLFGGRIIDLVSLRFDRNYMPLMILSISIQITVAMFIEYIISLLKKKFNYRLEAITSSRS